MLYDKNLGVMPVTLTIITRKVYFLETLLTGIFCTRSRSLRSVTNTAPQQYRRVMSLEHQLGSQLFQCKVHSLKAILLTTAHPLIDPVLNHLIISFRLPSDYITGRFPNPNASHVSWPNIFTKTIC